MAVVGRPREPRRQLRFIDKYAPGDPYRLDSAHPAVREARTIFISKVKYPEESIHHLLKSGEHNRKIGRLITKGKWKGMPIFTLTLEERKTCPEACKQYLDCYGNHMQWPDRWRHGPALEEKLGKELVQLAAQYPRGFVVRLHILGDFYSVDYVGRWAFWIGQHSNMHVYGYTAWGRDTPIGMTLDYLSKKYWERFAIRFSGSYKRERGTVTVYKTGLRGRVAEGIVCPAQTEENVCCATCALCWGQKDRIVFMAH